MRIAESSMAPQSSRTAVSVTRETASLSVRAAPPPPEPEDRVELSAPCEEPDELLRDGGLEAWLSKIVLEAFGVEVREHPGLRRGHEHAPGQQRRERGGVSVELRIEREHLEAEHVSFAAAGTVTTADGKRIDVGVRLDMSREHFERTTLAVRAGGGERKDPLVINLQGGAAQLGGPRLDFDLDADGEAESIATPSGGSAFLAVDANGDGRINDGSELFGARTGDGFAELARLDGDGDGWIDEDDAGWASLRVWDTTTGSLLTLREAGVGAIHTGAVGTEFALGRTAAKADGFIAKTGVFLFEQGGAGTVQHVDLVV